nr:hypothetical protein [Tanacetum cinerariifolium]
GAAAVGLGGVGGQGPKVARARAQAHGHVAATLVARKQVRLAIAVHVGYHQAVGQAGVAGVGGSVARDGPKIAAARAQLHVYRIARLLGHEQVGFAVGVYVGRHDVVGVVARATAGHLLHGGEGGRRLGQGRAGGGQQQPQRRQWADPGRGEIRHGLLSEFGVKFDTPNDCAGSTRRY